MKNEIPITTLNSFAELSDFVRETSIAIVYVESNYSFGFNRSLARNVYRKYSKNVECATIEGTCFEENTSLGHLRMKMWLNNIGIKKFDVPLPGYYLFINNNMQAFHPVAFSANMLKTPEEDPVQTWFTLGGMFMGAVTALITKRTTSSAKAFLAFAEIPEAIKIAQFFEDFIKASSKKKSSQKKQENRKKRQKKVVEDELQNAYQLLKVSPNATNKEIRDARNDIVMKYHPDKSSDKHTKYVAQVNNAYTLIMKSRKQ